MLHINFFATCLKKNSTTSKNILLLKMLKNSNPLYRVYKKKFTVGKSLLMQRALNV